MRSMVRLCGMMALALWVARNLANQAKSALTWGVTEIASPLAALSAASRRATNMRAVLTTFARWLMYPRMDCRWVLVMVDCRAAAAKHLVMTDNLAGGMNIMFWSRSIVIPSQVAVREGGWSLRVATCSPNCSSVFMVWLNWFCARSPPFEMMIISSKYINDWMPSRLSIRVMNPATDCMAYDDILAPNGMRPSTKYWPPYWIPRRGQSVGGPEIVYRPLTGLWPIVGFDQGT